MNKRKLFLIGLSIAVAISIFTLTDNTLKAAETRTGINIATTPEKVLFDLTNLQPGDWAERSLTIENKGNQDFNYLFSSKLIDGSEKFYNELDLMVADQERVLFEGKMKDFTKLAPRFIAKNNTEQLFFKVGMPEELGNEFQGLYSKVEFKFYVEGTLGGLLPSNGPKLPETGTNIYHLVVSGLVIVLLGTILQFIYSVKRRKFVN